MRKIAFFAFLLLLSSLFADFRLDRVDVSVSDIQKDGTARVEEKIKLLITGQGDQALYRSGVNNNDISYWSSTTKISEIRRHINEEQVDISNFNLRQVSLSSKKCNPLADICQGELIIDYEIHPYYDNETKTVIPNTGLFSVEDYKPRTTRYTLNNKALAFRSPGKINNSASTSTGDDVVILDSYLYFTMFFPDNTEIVELNQPPTDSNIVVPSRTSQITWNEMILTRFKLSFDVEEGLDKEVTSFFSKIPKDLQDIFAGEQSIATIIIIIILFGSYIYLKTLDKK